MKFSDVNSIFPYNIRDTNFHFLIDYERTQKYSQIFEGQQSPRLRQPPQEPDRSIRMQSNQTAAQVVQ